MNHNEQQPPVTPQTKDVFNIDLEPWVGSAIMLLDLDAFFASVEQLDHPGWRGKPVIVGGNADKRGVVAAASYEARTFGVRSAMPASQAARLCPDAIWTRGHFHRYREVSNEVMKIIEKETPHIQQVSIDEAFVDISPTQFNKEHPIIIAKRIQSNVEQLGITCSIGLGASKSIAKIASDMDKPRGLTVVFPGRETDFLAPLPIKCLSGVGPAAQKVLIDHNIKTLSDIAHADEALLKRVFGKNAEMMRDRALGRDRTQVEPEDSVKSVSNETSFAEDITTETDLRAGIATMAAKVGRRLRKKQLKGKTIALKLRFGDRSIHTVQQTLDTPTDDELFYTPLLYEMARKLWTPGIAVRLVGVAMSGIDKDLAVQASLFNIKQEAPLESDIKPIIEDPAKRSGLLSATDKVKNRFGEDAVQFGNEFHTKNRTTETLPKNPADYKEQT